MQVCGLCFLLRYLFFIILISEIMTVYCRREIKHSSKSFWSTSFHFKFILWVFNFQMEKSGCQWHNSWLKWYELVRRYFLHLTTQRNCIPTYTLLLGLYMPCPGERAQWSRQICVALLLSIICIFVLFNRNKFMDAAFFDVCFDSNLTFTDQYKNIRSHREA